MFPFVFPQRMFSKVAAAGLGKMPINEDKLFDVDVMTNSAYADYELLKDDNTNSRYV